MKAVGETIYEYAPVLTRGENARKTAVHCAGLLSVKGTAVSLVAASQPDGDRGSKPTPLIDLPSYPWNHALKFWSESRRSQEDRFRQHPPHDF